MPIISSMSGNFSPIGRSRKPFNLATGGTTTDVTNYNGTGQIWRVHTFTPGTPSLVVIGAANPFSTIIVAGGGNGGTGVPNGGGGGGGGGGVYYSNSLILTPQTYAFNIGAGLGGFTGDVYPASPNGNNTTGFGITCGGGGGGGVGFYANKHPAGPGSGGNGGSGGGGTGGTGGAGSTNTADLYPGANGGNAGTYTITGTSSYYGEGGSSGNGGIYGNGGGAIGAVGGIYGNPSNGGVIIVAYQIG